MTHTHNRHLNRTQSALCIVLLFLCLDVSFDNAYAQSAKNIEYRAKAAFIYNFLKFISYPESAFPSPHSPIIITIGSTPDIVSAFNTLKGKKIKGRPLIIEQYTTDARLKKSHVVFFSSEDEALLQKALPALQTENILTIGETDRCKKAGGIIHFYPEGTRLRFEINITAAERARLKISSELLRLAKITR